jgi:hypothetical protein
MRRLLAWSFLALPALIVQQHLDRFPEWGTGDTADSSSRVTPRYPNPSDDLNLDLEADDNPERQGQ